jgi:2-methylcitrate dehydratase PrpD
METILQHFSRYFGRVKYEDLPAEVVDQAKILTVDLMGVSIAGLQRDFPRIIIAYLLGLGGLRESTLLGTNKKVPAVFAAFGNGVSGHALDMDDGYRFGGVHTGVTVIPAALACAEVGKRDGKSFLLSVVLGFEIVNRLSKAMNPSHLNRGFHTTGTIGVFGAAAACGVIAGLNEGEMVSAMGMAGLQGAGLLEILNDGAMVKPLHPGKASMAGILSVELAKRGAKGPATVLEGNNGFFKAMADKVTLDELYKDLGEHYSICDQYVKFHAACRHTHPAIDGLLAAMKGNALKFKDIETIRIATYPVAINFCGKKTLPGTAEAAKFSLPYSTAMAAYFGDLNEDRFTKAVIANRDIQSLASRISIKSETKWDKAYPEQRGATIVIKTKQGGVYTVEVPLAKGEPENPASVEEIVSKFRQNASWIGEKMLDELLEVSFVLDKRHVADLTKVMRRISPSGCRKS